MPPLPPPQLDEKGTILRLVIVEYKDSFFYWYSNRDQSTYCLSLGRFKY